MKKVAVVVAKMSLNFVGCSAEREKKNRLH